jgi:L-tartrate/succinate antiporter
MAEISVLTPDDQADSVTILEPSTRPARMPMRVSWPACLPPAVAIAIALIPPPEGLAAHAWYFFALFMGVIVGLMTEPIPGPAISLIGVTLITVLARWVLYSPAELNAPGFDPANASVAWALSGFSNSTVWLIFGAFTFGLGYEKTGLGRRLALLLVRAMGRNTLTLGYAIVAADALLAPFTPSATARSAGTVYPVIRNLPPLYGSKPNDPSRRLIGSYLLWTALASCAITNSMFLTGMAPNLLAVELVRRTLNVHITWMQWFTSFAPVGLGLLLALPPLVYLLYPPTIKQGNEVAAWAAEQLRSMGTLSGREVTLAVLVLLALMLWILGGTYVNPTTAALVVVGLMLLTSVVSWEDMAANRQAWATLVWFATLIALAEGLNRTGFVAWLANTVAAHVQGFSPRTAIVALVSVYFFSHYLFASLTAHTTAMLPVILAVGAAFPGMPLRTLAIMLVMSGGIGCILTPYSGGPNPAYYGSGYLPARDFWRLGAVFGLIFFGAWLSFGIWVLPVR